MSDQDEKEVWEALRDSVFEDAVMAWGTPTQLAGLGAIRREDARLLRNWLSTLETIFRALLTVMAVKLVPSLPARRPGRGSARAGAKSPAPADEPDVPGAGLVPDQACGASATAPDNDAPTEETRPPEPTASETWTGLQFALARSKRKAGARKRGPSPGRARDGLVPALALARRFEALIRAVGKPEPHARRLARLLARERYAAARVLVRPDRHGGPNLYGDIVEDALALAWDALRAPAAEAPAPDTG